MITTTFYGELIGDREYLPRFRCTCALDMCCFEHSYSVDDPGDVLDYEDDDWDESQRLDLDGRNPFRDPRYGGKS